MFDPHSLIALLNQNLQTRFQIFSHTEFLESAAVPSPHAIAFKNSEWTVVCEKRDLKYKELISGLFLMSSDEEDMDETALSWYHYLEKRQLSAPVIPKLNSIYGYRICKITGFSQLFKQELRSLASELLQGNLLFSTHNEMIFLLENQSTLRETLEAFHETLTLELGQPVTIFVSPGFFHVKEMLTAYDTLGSLETLLSPSEASKGLVLFETHMTDLLLEEWLNHDQGAVYQTIKNMQFHVQLDEETLRTIEVLFKMNLNLTDTAKALFIHRNTLIYRLDKIERQFGFDLRTFEDAYRIKLLLKIQ